MVRRSTEVTTMNLREFVRGGYKDTPEQGVTIVVDRNGKPVGQWRRDQLVTSDLPGWLTGKEKTSG